MMMLSTLTSAMWKMNLPMRETTRFGYQHLQRPRFVEIISFYFFNIVTFRFLHQPILPSLMTCAFKNPARRSSMVLDLVRNASLLFSMHTKGRFKLTTRQRIPLSQNWTFWGHGKRLNPIMPREWLPYKRVVKAAKNSGRTRER